MVVIRMKRAGAKKRPFYRVVVADSRSPRDGRYIEQLGYYDPLTDPATWKVDAEKFAHWIRRGATPSESVGVMMAKHSPEAMRPTPLIAPAPAATPEAKAERKAAKKAARVAKKTAKTAKTAAKKKPAAKKTAAKKKATKGGDKKAKARAKKKSGVAPKRAVKKAKKKKS